ncbi:siphovirus Gp157 family protein [Fusobacteria bacterium ZRK30]|nr:siphovirus Gp157 family protein [Fusobacteria bacterium ZRK30]
MKLYEARNAMVDSLDIFLESDQDNMDQEMYKENMEYLRTELANKSSNIIKYIFNINSDVSGIKEELDRLTKLKKSKESKMKNLKGYLVSTMESLNKLKIETDLGVYGLRRSSKVDIFNIDLIPEGYIREKREVSFDKKSIGADIKSGKLVEGARIIENYSLQLR